MLKEFKEFVLRGNVVDLAVAIVIGAAFGTVVTSFVDSFLSPLIGLITGGANLNSKTATISDATFTYGAFITTLISFLAIAAAVFFFVVKPVNTLMQRRKTEPEVASTTKDCPQCLSSIPAGASRCAFCTSKVA